MNTLNREAIQEGPNPLGMEGIEFIEYETSQASAARPSSGENGFSTYRAASFARSAVVPSGRFECDRERA